MRLIDIHLRKDILLSDFDFSVATMLASFCYPFLKNYLLLFSIFLIFKYTAALGCGIQSIVLQIDSP